MIKIPQSRNKSCHDSIRTALSPYIVHSEGKQYYHSCCRKHFIHSIIHNRLFCITTDDFYELLIFIPPQHHILIKIYNCNIYVATESWMILTSVFNWIESLFVVSA